MFSTKVKIGLLVAVHVVAGLLLAWTARLATTPFPISKFGLFALVFAEAGMLGIWGGLSTMRLVWRLLAVPLAILYLWRLVVPEPVVLLLIALTAVTILVVLVVLRHSRRKLRLAHLENESPASEGFQFSISHLLVATALVATVLGVGRGVRAISTWQENMFVVAVFPPCFVMVELAALWAALGLGRPWPRLAVVVPTAFVVGDIPIFYMGTPAIDVPIWQLIIWPIIMGLQTIVTAASLLTVRCCGYRLVRSTTDGL